MYFSLTLLQCKFVLSLKQELIKTIYLLTGLPNKKLYPTVSAVYGNTEVSMIYLGPPLDG